ncbi:hypothetical protein LCGC14_2698660, partial [marine sediment metagenome]
ISITGQKYKRLRLYHDGTAQDVEIILERLNP